MNKILKHQAGLSLVEIMVAMVISLFLLGGIVQVYMGNRAAYSFSDASSRIQENGRFALDAMATDLRVAGFWGCVPLQDDVDGDGLEDDNRGIIQNHLNEASGNYSPARHDFLNQPSLTATVNDGLNGSDSLTVFGARPGQTALTGNLVSPGDAAIQVGANSFFNAGDIILITNCFTADIFEATAVSADGTTISHTTDAPADTPGNVNLPENNCGGAPSHCLMDRNDRPYTPTNAAAFALQNITYSVQANANGEPSLWRSVNNNNQELIEGVEQMQVLFGVDTDADGTPNQYLPSDVVVNLNQVTAVRVWLVVRSNEDNVTEENQAYSVNGQNFVAPDFRMRQVFSATIALRNKTG